MKTGIELISIERQEQIEKHGYTIERDLRVYPNSQELKDGAMYLLNGMAQSFPRRWSSKLKFKLDQKSDIEKLIIAGALIAAEIDRLQASS